MNTISLLLAISSLPIALFFTVAKFTGGIMFKFLFRFLGIFTTVMALLVILKYFNLIT